MDSVHLNGSSSDEVEVDNGGDVGGNLSGTTLQKTQSVEKLPMCRGFYRTHTGEPANLHILKQRGFALPKQ